MATYEAKYILL